MPSPSGYTWRARFRFAARSLLRFGFAIHAPPAADDYLDVLGGAGPADGEQSFLRLGSRHSRQRPHLRVRELTPRECLLQPWQRTEGTRDANVLAGGAGLESDAPAQPVRARAKAVAPAAARVEFANEVEQPRRGGIEMRSELGDLVAKPLQLDDVRVSRDDARAIDGHRRFSLRRLYIVIFEATGRRQQARSRTDSDFFDWRSPARIVAPPGGSSSTAIDRLRTDDPRARKSSSRVENQIHPSRRPTRHASSRRPPRPHPAV
jgi:hypothetical protein